MKANLRSGIVLAMVAGCACSVAMAQPGGRHVAKVKEVHRITQSAQAPEPLYIEVNGVRYPYRDTGGSDDNFNIYQNGVGTTNHTAWFTGTQPLGEQTLDDVSFVGSYGAGSGRLVNRMTLNITVAAAAPSSPSVGGDVEIRVWNTLNTAGTPTVNTNLNAAGVIRVAFPAPAAGWAANTIYFRDVDLSTLGGGGLLTTSDSFAVELRYLQPGLNPPFFHPDLAVGFEGTGVEHGTSQDVAWDDNASTPNGIVFETGDAFNFGGTAGNLTNFAIAMQANVTLPTGACCLTDGSCDATKNVVTCAGVAGVYRGDGASCATANCPPPGACCRSSGACSSITGVACTAAGGIYRGDSTCCTSANCLIGFDNGPPQTCLFNGGASHLGLSSGNLSAALPYRRQAEGFSFSQAATITEIDQDGFIPAGFEFNTLNYIIYSRVDVPANPQTNPIQQPGNGAGFTASIVASGSVPFVTANLIQDPRAEAGYTGYAMTGLSVALPAGKYFITTFPSDPVAAGGNTNYARFCNAQLWSAIGNTPQYNFNSAGAMTWRNGSASDPNGYSAYTGGGAIAAYPTPTFGPNPQDPNYIFGTGFTIKTSTVATTCYPNCDQSTTAPILNVLDFSCFLNKFAAGSCYANCDNSTTPPVLNVLDFGCFLNRFAGGCT